MSDTTSAATFTLLADGEPFGEMSASEARTCRDFLAEHLPIQALIDFFDWMVTDCE